MKRTTREEALATDTTPLPGEEPSRINRDAINAAFQPGNLIEGKYRVLEVSGEGSMGMIFLGEDEPLQRMVALKVINPDAPGAVRSYFRQEAAAMARIRHPNVAQIFSFGEHGGCPFFAMEYIFGEHLRAFIDRQNNGEGVPMDVALGILQQVCAGLAEVHRQGLVHYDVKPENVIIGPEYRVYLVDFGVAQPAAEGIPELAGTPPYIAPEVVSGDEMASHERLRSDIFSLGAVAFELFTGHQPFVRPSQTEDLSAMLAELAAQEPLALSRYRRDLPAGFEEALARAMARDPSARFSDSEAFYSALALAREQSTTRTCRQVLVVDDDPDIRMIYRAVFEAVLPDGEVHAAADGLVAFELAKALRPSLIVVDLNMPEVNGVELCSLLRGTEELANVPIVVISAELDQRTHAVLARLGVSEALPKPIKPRELVSVASRYL